MCNRVDGMERRIELRVNGVVVEAIRTDVAVAADYISFMEGVTRALMNSEALEREANASGRTIKHDHFDSFGSLPITDSKGL